MVGKKAPDEDGRLGDAVLTVSEGVDDFVVSVGVAIGTVVVGHSVMGDSVMGDSVTGNSVIGENVMGVGDVTGEDLTGAGVTTGRTGAAASDVTSDSTETFSPGTY